MTGRLALVLAAGAARRFGGGKLTADWRNRPLVAWAVRAALAMDVDEVRLVVGADAGAVSAAVDYIDDTRLRTVVADRWADGLSASLRAGLTNLPPDVRSIALFLGDMPDIDPTLAARLFDAVEAGAPAARPLHADGPGHPIVVCVTLVAELLTIRGDEGGRSMLAGLGDRLVLIPTADRGAVFDIDTPADLDAGRQFQT